MAYSKDTVVICHLLVNACNIEAIKMSYSVMYRPLEVGLCQLCQNNYFRNNWYIVKRITMIFEIISKNYNKSLLSVRYKSA